MIQENHAAPAGPSAIRLTFSYEGNDIRLVSRQHVNVLTPPSEPLEGRLEGQSGFWIEVRSESDQPLHRQLMHDPIRDDAEVFSDDPERSVARVPLDRPSGVFAVLIPEIDEADYLALVGIPLEERRTLAEARDIARFSLTE